METYLSIYKIAKLRFAARQVDILSLLSVTLSEAKSVRRGRVKISTAKR